MGIGCGGASSLNNRGTEVTPRTEGVYGQVREAASRCFSTSNRSRCQSTPCQQDQHKIIYDEVVPELTAPFRPIGEPGEEPKKRFAMLGEQGGLRIGGHERVHKTLVACVQHTQALNN